MKRDSFSNYMCTCRLDSATLGFPREMMCDDVDAWTSPRAASVRADFVANLPQDFGPLPVYSFLSLRERCNRV